MDVQGAGTCKKRGLCCCSVHALPNEPLTHDIQFPSNISMLGAAFVEILRVLFPCDTGLGRSCLD